MKRCFRVIAAVLLIVYFSLAIVAQDAVPTGPQTGDLRILFDSLGGFKLLRYTGESYQSVLNPENSSPVQIEVFRDGLAVPRTLLESKPTVNRAPEGAFAGPSFSAGGVRIDLYGIDLDQASAGTAAIRYDISNTSGTIQNFGFKIILDTYLGEAGPNHFADQSGEGTVLINDERSFVPSDKFHIVESSSDAKKNGIVLLVTPRSGVGSSPDHVVFANVRRLQNSGNRFEIEEGRIFNLVPFSVNDSAVALYYDNIVLLPGQSVSVDIVLSGNLEFDQKNAGNVVVGLSKLKLVSNTASSGSVPQATPTPGPSSPPADRQSLLKKLNTLIEELNRLIDSGTYKTATIERMLEQINELRSALAGKT